jgi:hypothetical protein
MNKVRCGTRDERHEKTKGRDIDNDKDNDHDNGNDLDEENERQDAECTFSKTCSMLPIELPCAWPGLRLEIGLALG